MLFFSMFSGEFRCSASFWQRRLPYSVLREEGHRRSMYFYVFFDGSYLFFTLRFNGFGTRMTCHQTWVLMAFWFRPFDPPLCRIRRFRHAAKSSKLPSMDSQSRKAGRAVLGWKASNGRNSGENLIVKS